MVDKNFILIFRNFEYSVATIVRPKNSENAAAKKSYMFFKIGGQKSLSDCPKTFLSKILTIICYIFYLERRL